ncbi:MAG TPA: alpha/beta hydrolase [Pirellulaceae bacterium]|nr:alpha/beta hydrolase [Pirellulaceae bacterium]
MQRAVLFLLILGVLSGSVLADESELYRGQRPEQWLQQLSHLSASARAAAAQAFVVIGKGNESVVAPLIELLSDPDERVRFYAAYALGKVELRHEQCIKALVESLRDKDEHVRYTAQWSLAEIAKQIASSSDDEIAANEDFVSLLDDVETQMLATGAIPGHLKQIRGAIARFAPPAIEPAQLTPPLVVAKDDSDDIKRCLQAFSSEDVIEQAKAIELLRKLGPKGAERLLASPEVVNQLGGVRWHLPTVIAGFGEPVVPLLMKALLSADEDISDIAASTLRVLGPRSSSVLPELTGLLESDETSDGLKQTAVGVLVEMGPAAVGALDLLVEILSDADAGGDLQRSAAEALGAIGPDAKPAVPTLVNYLADADASAYVQVEVASALARIAPNSEEVIDALIAAIQKSENIFDAVGMAECLGNCDGDATAIVPWLLDAIAETEYDQRAAVIRLLAQFGASRAAEVAPRILERLMDPGEELIVRVAAAKALGTLGSESLQPVIDELQNGDEANQLIAARTLVEIGAAATPAKEALHEMLMERRADNELRSLAAVALGQLGTAANDAAPALTELLRDQEADSYLRSMCAVALGQVDPSAVTILESSLDDPVPDVQIAVAYSLCKLDPQHRLALAKLVHWLEDDEYRGSAIAALTDIGESSFAQVVERMNDTSELRDTRVACLEVLRSFDERAIEPLLHALNDQELADEAGWALRDRGNKLLPILVVSIEDEATFTPEARHVMGNVVRDMFDGFGAGGDDETWSGGHVLVQREEAYQYSGSGNGAAMMQPEAMRSEAMLLPPELAENHGAAPEAAMAVPEPELVESPPIAQGYKTVDVFYGTNRQPIDDASNAPVGRMRWFWLIGLGGVVAVVVWLVGLYRRGARRQATAGLAGTTLLLLFGLLLFARAKLQPTIEKTGPRYGGDYSERVEMGGCQVTIPDTHREGKLEAPTLFRLEVAEDLQKHIVLRHVQRMESDDFFAGLRKEMQRKGNHILVFVHGFNVSFEDAARRTAQMASDLKFDGAPVFYSWPSQADWWKYRVDEKNVALSVDQLKSFLLAIAERSDADTINLVAHSMGNRVLTDALKEIDVAATEREQLFNQVILAAPDIDADIFRQRIAPAIVTKAKHVTLYASSKDLALVASRTFNSGDPRAGDAGGNLVVYPGIETIDVSAIDSSLLGHSYYGSSVSVLSDIEFLLRDQPASSRKFLAPVSLQGDLTYWLFEPPRISRRANNRDAMR